MRRLRTASAGTGAMMPHGHTMLRKRQPAHLQRVPVRRRPRSLVERILIGAGVSLGILSGLGGAAYWGLSSGWGDYLMARAGQRVVAATMAAGYRIETLAVEGRRETSKNDVALALGALRGDPILALDLEAARQRLVDLPWVTAAVVERQLPDTLRVVLTEAEPLALWQRQGVFHLVSRDGAVLAIEGVGRFGHLPVIVGDAAPQAAGELFALLGAEPDLGKRITAAVYLGQRRWNLRTDNGVDIKLPELDAAAAWSRLAALERQQNLLDKDITVIDLRQSDKLVVRQSPLPPAATEQDGKANPADGVAPVLTPAVAPEPAAQGASNET